MGGYIMEKTVRYNGCAYAGKKMGNCARLSDINVRARDMDEKYNSWLSFKKRAIKAIAGVFARKKEKAANAFPAFSGAFGLTVVLFTVFSYLAGSSRNFEFAIGGEAFLAVLCGVGCYFLLKKFCND